MKFLLSLLLNLFVANGILASDHIVVTTTSGDVYGSKKNKVILFEDIPYAKPPIGYLRWKAPRPITEPVKIFPKKNNFCMQRPSNLGGAKGDKFYVGTEDCLYLDIHVPKNSVGNLPVMLWIHGGGNTSGLKDIYDFSKMVSKHEVIVVRINYRLGPFGWFTHPSIQDLQDGDDKTSNFGTLDIIMALKWVKNNISKFGGDSSNVTIFGESAGGHNVLSLLASKKAKGLFHKAISMSGYTTSISLDDAYKSSTQSATSNYSSSKVVNKLTEEFNSNNLDESENKQNQRDILLSISAEDFFKVYADRQPYEEIPLLTADGIVIPKLGLRNALSQKEHLNIVPTILGSNRDEVKLWLATARYFVDLDYSLIGSILRIPKVKLTDEQSFEAFNYYRSSAWKIRGVDEPLRLLGSAGNKNLYAYRYDWDDHRRFVVADFQKLIGAAHATEIPLLSGNSNLVGGYPLSDLIYPPSLSKKYTSKNMMLFWTNFAKTGNPGQSSNSIKWELFNGSDKETNYLIIDKKSKLRMVNNVVSYESLTNEIIIDERLSDLEKCVVLFQMFTYVGEDVYEEKISNYPKKCSRKRTEEFLKNNASYIEY